MAEQAFISIGATTAKALAMWVAARAWDEIQLHRGFEGQLQKLKDKLEVMQAFLDDAGNPKYAGKSQLVKLWVEKVKDAAYLADDVMDEYAIEIFRRIMEPTTLLEGLCNFCTPSNPLFFHVKMVHKVRDILILSNDITKGARDIGLNQVDIVPSSMASGCNADLSQHRQYPDVGASNFVGREKDQEKLLNVICNRCDEERPLSFVAIVGIGGMGKTTLAKRLYDHERICDHFDKKIWICVSNDFKIDTLLNEMIESLTSRKSELSNSDAIKRKLRKVLSGMKLLFVFDDAWCDSEHLWGSIKALLESIGIVSGSAILTTTRSYDVARAAGALFQHKLEGFSEQDSWSLLSQVVFKDRIQQQNSRLEEVGRSIVAKCRGVPLAIKVIGELLQRKQLLHEWESVEKSELWDPQQGESGILPWLLLSFNHLPSSSVKLCFAYYAVLPKGCSVYKNELIGLWLSQGYLHDEKRKNLTMEEIGEENLKILVCNSLLEEHVSKRTEMVVYKMHDLVFDLAVYVCGSDLVREVKDLSAEGSCRHLLFSSETSNISGFEKGLKKLRTLRFVGSVQQNVLIHTRYLRTLFLYSTGITEVPPSIELLKHLRFLDVSHNPISTLPDSMGRLYQLQTIILQGCTRMKKLPKVLNKLVNLRHISTLNAPMLACKGLQHLTNLQNLPILRLDGEVWSTDELGDLHKHRDGDGEGWSIDELGDLHELGEEIHIQGLDFVKNKEQARKAGLYRKTKITKLNLSWAKERVVGRYYKEILEGLEPHPNLTSLEVHNFYGKEFPTWVIGMSVLTSELESNRTRLNNLTVLKLLNCSGCQTLPTLGHLPLERLILSGFDVEVISIEFYGGDNLHMSSEKSFKCLRELEISEFYNLTTWMEPQNVAAFPSLETLRIISCWRLKSVSGLDIKTLSTLKLVDLWYVESLDIMKYNPGLTSVIINHLPKIRELPQEVASCRKLKELQLHYLEKLECLPSGLETLSTLQTMKIVGCIALNYVLSPSDIEGCSTLERLQIHSCWKFVCSPSYISTLRRLSDLSISFNSAEHFRSVLGVARNLTRLMHLGIGGFNDEEEMNDYFSDITYFTNLKSLKFLLLWGCPNIKTIPHQLGSLRISGLLISSFKDLEEIPDWVCNSSLGVLKLNHCPNLRHLPSNEVLHRLYKVAIFKCPVLEERYRHDNTLSSIIEFLIPSN